METGEIIHEKVYESPRPPKISLRDNWTCDLDSDVARSSKDTVRHRPDFKQALSILRQLKNQEDTAYYQKWQSYSSSWWNWQESWWHSSSEHHRDDGPGTD